MLQTIEKTTSGALQFIVDQDRKNIYPMQLTNLHSEINEQDGIFYGINLFMDIDHKKVLLGTFDNVNEVMHEINELYNTDLEIYCISGYDPAIHELQDNQQISIKPTPILAWQKNKEQER